MMKMAFAQSFKAVTFAILWLLAGTVQAQSTGPEFDSQAAYDVVQSTTDELLGQITENRELYRQDTDVFYADLNEMLSPVIDFERIARRVMAKYYRQANAEQQDAFLQAFKHSLMQVYAKALLEYDNEKIIVLPPVSSARNSDKRQRIDLELYNDAGEKFPITYSMYRDREGHWKMENVIVNGVNIGLTYRNQFARLMQNHQNDIDAVINNWSSEVTSDK